MPFHIQYVNQLPVIICTTNRAPTTQFVRNDPQNRLRTVENGPELRLLPRPHGNPKLKPVRGELDRDGNVLVTTPSKSLPDCETPEYVFRLFPGSEGAGIVKRRRAGGARRVLPLHFFRLPLPDAPSVCAYACGSDPADAADRSDVLLLSDPLGRFLYVTYLPDAVKAKQQVTLRLSHTHIRTD